MPLLSTIIPSLQIGASLIGLHIAPQKQGAGPGISTGSITVAVRTPF
jgi:hypothetical protein